VIRVANLTPALLWGALLTIGAARPGEAAPAMTWTLIAVAGAVALGIAARPGRLSPVAAWGRAGLAALFVVALLADWLAPAGAEAWGRANQALNAAWPLGTDLDGHDRLALWAFGARTALCVAAPVAVLSVMIGAAVGLAAGWRRDARFADAAIGAALSTPMILVQLTAVGLLRPTGDERLIVVIVVLTLTSWAGAARLLRGEAQALAHAEATLAARAVGLTGWQVLRHHALPHLAPTLAVLVASAAGHALLAEAALSFLGIGLDQDWPSWGAQFARRRGELLVGSPEPLLYAGSIVIAALSLHSLADGLADMTSDRRPDPL
jgi:peptide/nickel transport system permease protein